MARTVLGKPYSTDMDYLLRNELRLLGNEIEEFIGSLDINEARAHERAVLTRALDKGGMALFTNLCNEMESRSQAKRDFDTLAELCSMRAQFISKHNEVSVSNYRSMLTELHAEQDYLLGQYRERLSENMVKRYFAVRVLRQLGDHETETGQDEGTLPSDMETLVQYNRLMADGYVLQGSEKEVALLEAARLHPEVALLRPSKTPELIRIYGNLAIDHFLAQRYEQAHELYLKALEVMGEAEPNTDLLFNYCVNALMTGRHHVFIEISDHYAVQIARSEKTRHRFRYFTAMAYLFDNKPREAFRFLDHDISKRPETEYFFYRLVYTMVYFQLGEHTLAEREVENIFQSFKSRSPNAQQDKVLLLLLRKLIVADANKANPKQRTADLTALRDELAHSASMAPHFSQTIFRWMRHRVGALLE